MEEVDNIILQALQQLGISFPDDISTLSEFPEDLVLLSAKKCLDVITGAEDDSEMPEETSLKIIMANEIASQCKKLGFKGEMGYELLLYPNEIDSRKIFSFLINKLPKETEKSYMYVARDDFSLLMQSISQKISEELHEPWTPPYCKMKNLEVTPDGEWTRSGCRYVYPFHKIPLKVAKSDNIPKAFINYWKQNVPDSTENFSTIPDSSEMQSLADEIVQNLKNNRKNFMSTESLFKSDTTLLKTGNSIDVYSNSLSLKDVALALKKIEDESKTLVDKINTLKCKKEEISAELNVEKVKETSVKEEKETVSLVSSLLPDFETNIEKLRKIHQKETNKLSTLKNEIAALEIQSQKEMEANEEYKMKHSKYSNEIKALETKANRLSDEYKKQAHLKLQLRKDCEKRNIKKKYIKKRSAYTKRIMEIIGNISKQKVEINKILCDTRILQKEMNNMNGRLDRSFTVVDELVFKDAKKDEHARKTYKLVAYIHTGCGDIVTKVNEIGAYLREIRDLEKRVETEKKKKIKENLERVYLDLKYLQSKKHGRSPESTKENKDE